MFQDPSFHVIGVSHHTAGVGVREQLAVGPEDADALLERERAAGRSAVLLSTCNRCELYWWGEHDHEPAFRAFAAGRGLLDGRAIERRDGAAAVRHLYGVAAGLESQILGETEILGQVRRAWDRARLAGASDRCTDAVFSGALAAGRRVRHETGLGRHPVSVSGAAVRQAAALWGPDLAECPVLVLGAGEAAEGALRALHEAGARRVVLLNRTPERAAVLGAAWGTADVRGWDALEASVAEADVVIAATAAPHAVLPVELVAAAQARREARHPTRALLLLDLCVPRNVAPEAARVPGVRVVDLDGLQTRYCPGEARAAPVLAEAERVLAEEIARLDVRLRGLAASPRLAELHAQAAGLAAEEVARVLSRCPDLESHHRDAMREMAGRLVQRVLYPVSRAVRSGDFD